MAPRRCPNLKNLILPSWFVKAFASCLSVPTRSTCTLPLLTHSRVTNIWYGVSMFLLLWWYTEILLNSLQCRLAACQWRAWTSSLHHQYGLQWACWGRHLWQAPADAAIYIQLHKRTDRATTLCFGDVEVTKFEPRKNTIPEVLFHSQIITR